MMATKRKGSVAGSLLAVTLVVAAVASSVPAATADERATAACIKVYSQLCGKGKDEDLKCAAIVDKACSTEADSITAIQRLFDELHDVGEMNYDLASTGRSGGLLALIGSVNRHGACPGNKTVSEYGNEHCLGDCDSTCRDPTCSEECQVDCHGMAARFGYVMTTPANKKAIEEDMACFKRCAKGLKMVDGTNKKCGDECKLILAG